jgi:serine-type D-Ala-D-Ala carboxypeptidase
LPEFKDGKGKATLRQLLSHTSGYPDYQPKGRHRDDYQTLEESVNHIINLPLDTIPGAAFHYGGLAMQVAGRMAEIASGKDWETLFQEKISRPLGMKNTHFTPVDSTGGHNPMVGGGARSTLHDYAHFLEMILHNGQYKGRQIISKNAIIAMQADQIGNAQVYEGEYVANARGRNHKGIYGLGEWREILDEKGEAVLISSPSWAGAYPWIDKENNIYGFFLAHVNVEKANQAGFSSFYNSPVIPMMVRNGLVSHTLPIEKGMINTSSANLYYEVTGSGPPIILLHGHSFDRRMWEPQMAKLSQYFTVIRYDMRGYGLSSMPLEGEQFLHAEDLYELMKTLKIEKAHLIGLSLGGAVATDFLALHPEMVLSITAASGAIWDRTGPDEPMQELEINQRLLEIKNLKKQGISQFKRNWLENLMHSAGSNGEKIRPIVWGMIDEWEAWQPLHIEPRLVLGRMAKNKLISQKVAAPILLIYGENDSPFSHQSSDALAELVPHAQKIVLKNSGHLSNLETPEAFTHAILEFLKVVE